MLLTEYTLLNVLYIISRSHPGNTVCLSVIELLKFIFWVSLFSPPCIYTLLYYQSCLCYLLNDRKKQLRESNLLVESYLADELMHSLVINYIILNFLLRVRLVWDCSKSKHFQVYFCLFD